jgi:hypothetical protein
MMGRVRGLAVAVAAATIHAACGGAAKTAMAPPAEASPAAAPAGGAFPGAPPPSMAASTGGNADFRTAAVPAPFAGAQAQVKVVPEATDAPHSVAMLIYTAHLAMAVFQVVQSVDGVERIGREVGGYLSARADNAITIRVPRERFEDAIHRIELLGDVGHRDIKAQDVTDEFVDLEARLKNAYAVRDRMKDLLSKASVKEAIDIEKELERLTEQIERLEGRLKLLRDEIAFSTITVTFSPIVEEQVHDTSLLTPFPWLQQLGLSSLLNVHP